jgi:hypothetical protein
LILPKFTLVKKWHDYVMRESILPGPALECGYDKEREHGLQHIVVVERVPVPHPLLYYGLVDVCVPDKSKICLKKINQLAGTGSFYASAPVMARLLPYLYINKKNFFKSR